MQQLFFMGGKAGAKVQKKSHKECNFSLRLRRKLLNVSNMSASAMVAFST